MLTLETFLLFVCQNRRIYFFWSNKNLKAICVEFAPETDKDPSRQRLIEAMLATSSSDDDDYDSKKPAPKTQGPPGASAAPRGNAFLSAQRGGGGGGGFSPSQPNTPNMSAYRSNGFNSINNANVNAMANVNLHNGLEDARSSFSTSSDNVSLNNSVGFNNRSNIANSQPAFTRLVQSKVIFSYIKTYFL